MGKSSSSLKKKRSKISSPQARIKKRRKSRTKRSYKLKKLRRHDDSVSYSSDNDDSRRSVSVSSSTSEDDYRSKRSRSRSQKDVKGSKKRVQRRSSSYESPEDSPRVKRRKGSKRSEDFQVRKKTVGRKKKKKSKREANVGSTSNGSWSCSTCRGGSSSSDESEVEKNRRRSGRKDKDRRSFEKVRSRMRRPRSRNCSSCSQYSDYRNEEKLTGDVNVRRLRSVITITREATEEKGIEKDEHKEEMEYDHNDYPSSRSNDSNDWGSKRELVHNSHFASEKKRHAEDEKGEEALVSNVITGKVTESDKECKGYDGSNPGCDVLGMNGAVKEKKNEDSGVVDCPNADDLESILRQKALENLRFRRGHQTDAKATVNQKDLVDSDVKTLTSSKAELFQNKSPKGGCARVVNMRQVTEQSSNPAESKCFTEFSQNDKKISERNDGGKESGAEHHIAYAPDHVVLAGGPNERVNVTVVSQLNKPRSIVLASRQESSNTCTKEKQAPALQEPPQSKSMTGNSVAESAVEAAETAISLSGKSSGEEVNKACGSASDDPSCPKSVSGGSSSNKLQDESKVDSQFQQKTMTVMRGGEMVEVSYKVYIPKKAPALSRRPLKR